MGQAIVDVLVPLYQEMLKNQAEIRKCWDIAAKVTQTLTYGNCNDLRRPEYQDHPEPLRGHCYIAAEVVYHLALREGIHLKPMFIRHNDEPHWYLSHRGYGNEPWEASIDPTAGQFRGIVDYCEGRGKGFLTRQPSKRATELMRRMDESELT